MQSAKPLYRSSTVWCLIVVFSAPGMLQAGQLAFRVTEPSGVARSAWPVTSGVPLAQGELTDAQDAALFTPEGRQVPLQSEVLSRWSDGSVRWLLLDFQIDQAAHEDSSLVLKYGAQTKRERVDRPLEIEQRDVAVTINTGPLRVELDPQEFRLLDRVWLDRNGNGQFSDDERVTCSSGAGIVLTTPDGQRFRADLAKAELRVEKSGPLRGCVRIEGDHASAQGKMFHYVVRLHAFRGQPFLRVDYTFINDNTPKVMSQVDAIELVIAPSAKDGSFALVEGKRHADTRLYQRDDLKFEINGQEAGKRAAGWAALGGSKGGFAVGVRKFWQNWPKSLEVAVDEGAALRVGILPDFSAGLYDGTPIKEECKLYYYLREGVYTFKIGAARTHQLWVTFFDGQPDNEQLGSFFQGTDKLLLAQCSPKYVSEARALGGYFPPADHEKYYGYDKWLDGFFQLHLDDQEDVREYGLFNYGDWYNVNWDSWGNLEYDLARCLFVQYLRTGDRRYFDRAEQAAWHTVDVDILHATNRQIQEYGGSLEMMPGQVWAHIVGHTGGYYGRYDGEKYQDEAPLVMKGAYQVGLTDLGHTWLNGIFDCYLLTGDGRIDEVARLAADALAQKCPTRYSDHIRQVGWPLVSMVAAYEATSDEKYMKAATRQWHVLKEHLDLEKGWVVMLAYGHCSEPSEAKRCHGQNAYMLALTLSGLSRYHRVTGNPEVLEALTVGLDQLIRECWDEENKSFYLGSCVHGRSGARKLSSATMLSSEAFAYEYSHTGNQEHRRIYRDALKTSVEEGFVQLAERKQQGATGYSSMMFHFTPYGFSLLDE